jgi:hypothetical protein
LEFEKEKKLLTNFEADDDGILYVLNQNVVEISRITKRHFRKGTFFQMSISTCKLLLEKEYNVTDLKLFIALMGKIEFNNKIKTFRQVDLAKEIKTSQSAISKSFKKLLSDGIIFKRDLDYYFNSNYIKGAGDK